LRRLVYRDDLTLVVKADALLIPGGNPGKRLRLAEID